MRIAKTIQAYTIILALLFVFATPTYAATTVEVGIPGQVAAGDTISGIPEYIKYLYYFVLGLVGIAGFASLVFWGAVWAGSGVIDKKAQAISGIKNTFTGIGIALTAFILLNTINPDLIVIKTPNVSDVKITGLSKDTLGAMTELQIKLAYETCKDKNEGSCAQDARCDWVDNRSRGYSAYCTSKQAAQCAGYQNQYADCSGAAECQKQAVATCNASNICEFSGNFCSIRVREPSGAGGSW